MRRRSDAESSEQQDAFTRQRLRERLLHIIEEDSSIPSFSASTQKVMEVSSREDVTIPEIAEAVEVDPGLTSKYLRLANSSYFGGKSITSVQDALLRIGLEAVRKLASTIAVMQGTACFRRDELVTILDSHVRIEWNQFWLHSLFTARLTEQLADAFRPTTGKEYLAGLLHDVGKLLMQHHMPDEFRTSTLMAVMKHTGVYEIEKQMFDTNHAEVGWAMTEKWKLHREITRSIRFHHEPHSPFNKDPSAPEFQYLLAACISLADSLANICGANILGSRPLEGADFEALPEWQLMQQYHPRKSLDLDPSTELRQARETIEMLEKVSDHPEQGRT
jgi:putative nucleotidyltransferase with HDIG domain